MLGFRRVVLVPIAKGTCEVIWSTHGLLGLAHLIMMMMMMVTHGSLFSFLFYGMVTQKVLVTILCKYMSQC